MNKYIFSIDGMKCGVCEMHVEDAIRKNLKAIKIKANHIHNSLVVICEDNLVEEDFEHMLAPTGYRITSFERTIAVKKFLGWK